VTAVTRCQHGSGCACQCYLQPLFKFAAKLCAGHERSELQCPHRLVFDGFRNFPKRNLLCQALCSVPATNSRSRRTQHRTDAILVFGNGAPLCPCTHHVHIRAYTYLLLSPHVRTHMNKYGHAVHKSKCLGTITDMPIVLRGLAGVIMHIPIPCVCKLTSCTSPFHVFVNSHHAHPHSMCL
jgi:hypothetical protein